MQVNAIPSINTRSINAQSRAAVRFGGNMFDQYAAFVANQLGSPHASQSNAAGHLQSDGLSNDPNIIGRLSLMA